VDVKNQLIAGHGRLLAAKQLGLPRVPVIRFDHLNEVQQRAYWPSVPLVLCQSRHAEQLTLILFSETRRFRATLLPNRIKY